MEHVTGNRDYPYKTGRKNGTYLEKPGKCRTGQTFLFVDNQEKRKGWLGKKKSHVTKKKHTTTTEGRGRCLEAGGGGELGGNQTPTNRLWYWIRTKNRAQPRSFKSPFVGRGGGGAGGRGSRNQKSRLIHRGGGEGITLSTTDGCSNQQ